MISNRWTPINPLWRKELTNCSLLTIRTRQSQVVVSFCLHHDVTSWYQQVSFVGIDRINPCGEESILQLQRTYQRPLANQRSFPNSCVVLWYCLYFPQMLIIALDSVLFSTVYFNLHGNFANKDKASCMKIAQVVRHSLLFSLVRLSRALSGDFGGRNDDLKYTHS